MCSGQFSITSLNGLIFGRSAGYNQKLSGVLKNSFKYALRVVKWICGWNLWEVPKEEIIFSKITDIPP